MKKLSFFIALSLAAISLTACSNVGTEGDSNQLVVPVVGQGPEPTEIERIAATYEPVEDGRLIMSETNPNVAYVYDNGGWREATVFELLYGRACLTSANLSITTFDDSVDYVCRAHLWIMAQINDYKKEMFFNKDVGYGSVKDERDGQVYRTIEIAGRVWMAENLSLKKHSVICYDVGCRYRWTNAMKVDESDSIVIEKNHQGICMDGWHIPDSTEWHYLLNEISIEKLKSSVGWLAGTNESGFSIPPTAFLSEFYRFDTEFQKEGNITGSTALFITADFFRRPYTETINFNTGYGVFIDNDGVKMVEMYKSAEYLYGALRCVKDSE